MLIVIMTLENTTFHNEEAQNNRRARPPENKQKNWNAPKKLECSNRGLYRRGRLGRSGEQGRGEPLLIVPY